MDLPVKFPSETDVILEDVARFRALSPGERVRLIRTLLADGTFLMKRSPKSAWAEKDFEEQKRIERSNILEFMKRHAS
jgi:hypothetical protein